MAIASRRLKATNTPSMNTSTIAQGRTVSSQANACGSERGGLAVRRPTSTQSIRPSLTAGITIAVSSTSSPSSGRP